MQYTIYNAMTKMISETGYNLEGSMAWKVNEPLWSLSMWTRTKPRDEPSTPVPIQEIDVEIILRDGGIVASVMRTANMKQKEITNIMDKLVENIQLD